MLRLFIVLALAAFAPIRAVADEGDNDLTPVPMCDAMPASAVISALPSADALRICRAMGLLDGVRVKDIRAFSKAAVVLSHEGYEASLVEITKQLVEIVRLRGLYDKPDRWYPNIDLIVRSYQAFNGVVTPLDADAFLAAAGDAAKTLSDKGFGMMLIYIKERKQQGD